MENENLFLIYVRPLGKNISEQYEYEFFFSETPETVWGTDWNIACPSACGDITPSEDTYSLIKRLKTIIPFFCAQQNSCFSMGDAVDHVIAIAWEDISEYEEYPEPYRIVFQFGEGYKSIENKLASRSQLFQE